MRLLAVAVVAIGALLLPTPALAAPGDAERIARLLDRVTVTVDRPYQPGYDRDCDPGACVFGAPWTDAYDGPAGRNGCDTRQDVLLRQMRDIDLRWGSRCRIYEAELVDPYTGRRLTWRRDGARIQIDHIYPLARAWHAGAWAWSHARRVRFANDVRRELLASGAAANQAKEDQSPGEWLPAWQPYRCTYVRKYLKVAVAWDLSVTEADAAAVRQVALSCG